MPDKDRQLTVILGAGSSHDCLGTGAEANDKCYYPPLVKDLFDPQYARWLSHYPLAETLSDEIRTKVLRGQNLETVLRSFAQENNIDVKRQYWEVPLYLQELFGEASQNFLRSGSTKFSWLVRDIALSDYTKVLYLTLNYDLFLEKALEKQHRVQIKKICDYVQSSRKWSVVKIHGSVRWGKRVENGAVGLSSATQVLNALEEEPDLAGEITVLEGHKDGQRFIDGYLYYPALAVPLEGKDEFVCPNEHVDFARRFLEGCTDFLVIGFSAKDAHVLELLGSVPTVERLKVVSEKLDAAQDTLDLLAVQAHPGFGAAANAASPLGFGGFLNAGELSAFLSLGPVG